MSSTTKSCFRAGPPHLLCVQTFIVHARTRSCANVHLYVWHAYVSTNACRTCSDGNAHIDLFNLCVDAHMYGCNTFVNAHIDVCNRYVHAHVYGCNRFVNAHTCHTCYMCKCTYGCMQYTCKCKHLRSHETPALVVRVNAHIYAWNVFANAHIYVGNVCANAHMYVWNVYANAGTCSRRRPPHF